MSRHPDDYRILQIMPAEGWCAVYVHADRAEGMPLAAWALIQERVEPIKDLSTGYHSWPADIAGTFTAMVGMAPSGRDWASELADDRKGFFEYRPCAERTDWHDHTAEYAETIRILIDHPEAANP